MGAHPFCKWKGKDNIHISGGRKGVRRNREEEKGPSREKGELGEGVDPTSIDTKRTRGRQRSEDLQEGKEGGKLWGEKRKNHSREGYQRGRIRSEEGEAKEGTESKRAFWFCLKKNLSKGRFKRVRVKAIHGKEGGGAELLHKGRKKRDSRSFEGGDRPRERRDSERKGGSAPCHREDDKKNQRDLSG